MLGSNPSAVAGDGSMAIKSIIPPNSRFGTISLNSEFLAPVTKGILEAKATVKFLENRRVQGVATVFNEDNMEVLKFSSLFKLAKDVKIETNQDKEAKISSLMDHVRNAAKFAEKEDLFDNFDAMCWILSWKIILNPLTVFLISPGMN